MVIRHDKKLANSPEKGASRVNEVDNLAFVLVGISLPTIGRSSKMFGK